MAKRFSRYNFALKASGGSGAAGSALEKYKNYKTGATKPTYTRDEASKPGLAVEIALRPFGAAKDGDLYIVQMSGRSNTNMAEVVEAVTVFNHVTIGDNSKTNESFKPAVAIIQRGGTGGTNQISKVTGESYIQKTGNASYTVPFGATASGTGILFPNVAREIKNSVEKKTTKKGSVSFRPERWAF